MSMMTARLRRSFTPEFKAHTVELVRTSGKSVGEICRDLDLTETAVRRWVAQADVDAGRRDGLTTAEREELSRLRRENRVLRDERDILKKAAAFCFCMTRWALLGGLAHFFAASVRLWLVLDTPPVRYPDRTA
jgi:transposase